MIAHVVPDTSVVIKWFRQGEVLADQALALRAAYVDGRLVMSVPALLAYELANVLRYKNDLTTIQVSEAVQSLFDMGMVWVSPSAEVMRRAAEIAALGGRSCQVSLENRMACGFGVCLGCAMPRADGGIALVCRDGPVFEAGQVAWAKVP